MSGCSRPISDVRSRSVAAGDPEVSSLALQTNKTRRRLRAEQKCVQLPHTPLIGWPSSRARCHWANVVKVTGQTRNSLMQIKDDIITQFNKGNVILRAGTATYKLKKRGQVHVLKNIWVEFQWFAHFFLFIFPKIPNNFLCVFRINGSYLTAADIRHNTFITSHTRLIKIAKNKASHIWRSHYLLSSLWHISDCCSQLLFLGLYGQQQAGNGSQQATSAEYGQGWTQRYATHHLEAKHNMYENKKSRFAANLALIYLNVGIIHGGFNPGC